MSVWSVLVPEPRRALLVRACVASEAVAREAFERWCAEAADPVPELAGPSGALRLVPTLAARVRVGGWHTPPALGTYLRASALREEERWSAIERIAGILSGEMAAAGVDALAIQGVAAAAWYPDPAQRHTHDLDLLVRPEAFARAIDASRRAGFVAADPARADHETPRRRHASGLELVLHRHACALNGHRALTGAAWRSARPAPAGRPFGSPSPAQVLAQRLVHGCAGRWTRSLVWAVDAHHLGAALGAEGAEDAEKGWSEVAETVVTAGAALPVSALLRFLAEVAGPSAPERARARLTEAARASAPAHWDWALHGALAGGGGVTSLVAAAAPGERTRLIRWLLAPSESYLRDTRHGAGGRSLAAARISRWGWAARRTVRWAVRPLRRITGAAS